MASSTGGTSAASHALRLFVRSKVVMCAAGALHTPALLLRSGAKNRNIGKHLHVHAGTMAVGVFPASGALKAVLVQNCA